MNTNNEISVSPAITPETRRNPQCRTNTAGANGAPQYHSCWPLFAGYVSYQTKVEIGNV